MNSALNIRKFDHLPRIGLGDACKLYGLTPRALRFYEERGLVTARRDRLNCRYYDAAARARIALIARLRTADLPIPDIRQILEIADDGGDVETAVVAALTAKATALAKQAAQVEALLSEFGAAATPAPRRQSTPLHAVYAEAAVA